MTEPTHDPKLKEALAKMEAIAKEYGIGFVIALANAEYSEFKLAFPEWSLIQSNPEGVRLRMRSAEPELTKNSLAVLFALRDMSGMMYENLEMVTQESQKYTEVIQERITDDKALRNWKKPRVKRNRK